MRPRRNRDIAEARGKRGEGAGARGSQREPAQPIKLLQPEVNLEIWLTSPYRLIVVTILLCSAASQHTVQRNAPSLDSI